MWLIREADCTSIDLAGVNAVFGYENTPGDWVVVAERGEEGIVVVCGLKSQREATWLVALLTYELAGSAVRAVSDTTLRQAVAAMMEEEARGAN